MANLRIDKLNKSYGPTRVLVDINLGIDNGEFVVLVGPSGCGKSTLLRMIAGLERITAGACFLDGVDVTNVAPAKRRIAMVFQSYALYPHMTARQNIAFSLSLACASRKEQDERTREVARILQLEDYLDRRPAELSGGQRQRVAIGRALVRKPEVFLFDEPLSNLDAKLRVQMRLELAKLHVALSATMIYVTHDQTEAMTLADKIVVLDKGKIAQVGSPLELYNHPANKFVAAFIGSPGMAAYVATKHGIMGLTKTAALEVATTGIRVNAVAPGIVNAGLTDSSSEEFIKQALAAHPIGRMAESQEIAAAVLWLCSDEASFVLGHTLPVEGGMTIH